ncbi:sulfite exporter TauE/SafE family protein [Sporomusa sp.]|uniref:sulfite exporter TauE/SafE family protein n=1 Tax=Sporomusa sp. TaxID=2078658 RepID=UPI002B5E6790|nr:sulfite exporter TauE/SafE family protein [Sporomusa sp.]HWR42265.1 sulfite exporter TauE/SafE family protein [Sporomusa sp.]
MLLTEIYIFIVLILSSFLQTTTGFGYAIITAPLLALVLGAKETVMLVMLTGLIVRLFLIRAIKNEGSFKAILPLITASVFGAIPGAYVMTIISSDGLKIFIGIVLLIATATMWKNCTIRVRHQKFVETIVGALSGFLATTTSINGPPIVLYYLNSNAEENKVVFRANLTRYFLLINIASIIISYFAGTFKIEELWTYVLFSIPALYIGFYLGEKFFHRINAEVLRKVSILMVFVSSIMIVATVLIKYL